ncbi:Dihydrolipoamide acetyltransferase component of pyruvate dehydrogenase complex [Minicystis rosea]|nr:Dihydrolipoamide acetyltransferase component of pyruvate dehydrogenase complex [Minicystis rosea]
MHQLGVAHGSVSPACILTAGQDRNARAYLADVQHTTPTPAYQSPERILGGDISTADDVWALAATLYALLTGQSPFAGQGDGEVRQRILAASPAPLAVFDVGDDDLQHILDRAFARDLGARTNSITAFRRALEEWHPDRGVANLPPLEDEDSTNDDEDVAHTMMVRDASSYMAQKLNVQPGPAPAAGAIASPGFAPMPASHEGGAPGKPGFAQAVVPKVNQDDDDDDDNVRTVMRALPQDDLASLIAKASAGGAPAPAAPQPAFPRPAAGAPAGPAFPRPAAGAPAAPAFGAPAPAPAFGAPAPAPAFGAPAPGFGAPAFGAPQPPGPPRPAAGAPAAPAFGPPQPGAFGGRPAPAPAPPVPDDDDDDDNARTMMRAPEQFDAPPPGPAAPLPAAGRPGNLGPAGARATALGGFQAGAAPGPAQGFAAPGASAIGPQPVFPQPGPPGPGFGDPHAPMPGPGAWSPAHAGPGPAATMAFPVFDGPNFPEPNLGGGTQPMGGPAMEAALAAMAAQRQSGTGLGAPGMMGPGGPSAVMPAPGGPGGPGMMSGGPGMMGGGPSAVMPAPVVGGMAPPGDLSALERPAAGTPYPGTLGAPPPPFNPNVAMAPVPAKSNKALLVVAAIVALLIAAGVTFVILRARSG